ncbi:MAG: galactose-1-phosphate uridylyltransferase [Psychromonas sp.]|jgi:galactose-1-phosphate uridylyltransferase|uniref:hypothetical protein n=1 Tax=Psychromonas sp. TaxID=1884585 RepID=UPI0039E71E8F
MTQEFKIEDAQKMMLSLDIRKLDFAQIIENINNDEILRQFSPDGICQIDPRNGNLVIYNSSRAKRIHTTIETSNSLKTPKACPICEGKSSEIFDLVEQSEGFTFINKNIYPIFHPIDELPNEEADYFLHQDLAHKGRASYGFHLLQWTSSIHHKDWHNMPFEDALLAFKQLARVEEILLCQPTNFMSRSITQMDKQVVSGYISIIKNYGAAAGASLTHGHQQIAYSNILPQRFFNNLNFRKRHNKSFSLFMLEENPSELLVKDYGGVVLMVPYFMKRPLDMLLVIKDSSKRYLHQLSVLEMKQVTAAIQEAIQAIIALMGNMKIQPAYNMIVNNGPGCGLYFEFLPQTQKMGGYEQIGLFVCQANAADSAKQLREQISAQSV